LDAREPRDWVGHAQFPARLQKIGPTVAAFVWLDRRNCSPSARSGTRTASPSPCFFLRRSVTACGFGVLMRRTGD